MDLSQSAMCSLTMMKDDIGAKSVPEMMVTPVTNVLGTNGLIRLDA